MGPLHALADALVFFAAAAAVSFFLLSTRDHTMPTDRHKKGLRGDVGPQRAGQPQGPGLWAPVSFLPLADLEKKSMNCPEKKSAERTEALVSCASASGSLFLLSCTHGAFFFEESRLLFFLFFFISLFRPWRATGGRQKHRTQTRPPKQIGWKKQERKILKK